MTSLRIQPDMRHPVTRQRVCPMCDTVSTLPELARGERAHCRYCGHVLFKRRHVPIGTPAALAITALILLAFSLSYDYISFSSSGISHSITLPQAATTPMVLNYPVLTLLFVIFVLLLPALYLIGTLYLYLILALRRQSGRARYVARLMHYSLTWVMPDIFVVGVLVSLIKIMSMASISVGISFWTFCGFSLLTLLTVAHTSWNEIWEALGGPCRAPEMDTSKRGLQQGMTCCHVCQQPGQVDEHGHGRCTRCNEVLHARTRNSIQHTLALLLVAAMLYIPSMLWPVMTINQLGDHAHQTIIGGVLLLIGYSDYPVALVIFFASVMVPVAKLMALLWLCLKTRQPLPFRYRNRMRLYHVTHFIGRWSMIDVFVVTVLGSMVQLGALMAIIPEHGIVAFASVVVITMVAAERLDPRLMWDAAEDAFLRQNTSLQEVMKTSHTSSGQDDIADAAFDSTQEQG